MKKKVIFIAPHLSTGGMPQYLYKQIELLKNDFEVYCIEWSDVTGGVLVIQRNRIKEVLKNKLITLTEDKSKLIDIINDIQPDVVHLQEVPELFMEYNVAKELYSPIRNYTIIETSHDSSYNVENKLHFPDKFLLVSQYQINNFEKLNIPCDLVEYPIEKKKKSKTKEEIQAELGLDPNFKHIINVGLFTPRKNQQEIIEYAKSLKDYPIQFHFIGNQADNFKFYWEPIMKDFPDNCKWWGERNDVDKFYQAADLFLFTSRGNENDKETMPLVIREALEYDTPTLIYNLPVYLNYFDKYKTISYLDFDNKYKNELSILNMLDLKPQKKNLNISLSFSSPNVLYITNNDNTKLDVLVSIRDAETMIPMYFCQMHFTEGGNQWFVQPLQNYDFENEEHFSTFLVEFYDMNKNLLGSKTLKIKERESKPVVATTRTYDPFDCLYINYRQMFYDKIYDEFDIDNLQTVVDVGANVGIFSNLMRTKNAKTIHAIEPTNKAFTQLHNQFKDNNNITCHKLGISPTDGTATIFSNEDNSTISNFITDHSKYYNTDNIKKEDVDVLSLETFYQRNNIKHIDLLKMDIEAMEYEVFNGTSDETILKCDRYLVEYHSNETGHRAEKLIQRFRRIGYDVDVRPDLPNNNVQGFFFAKKKVEKSESKLPEKAFITFATENYLPLAEKLVKSVIQNSEYPIILYSINCDVPFKSDYPKLYTKRIDDEKVIQPKLVKAASYRTRKDGDYDVDVKLPDDTLGIVDRYDRNTYLTLSRKPVVLLDAIEHGLVEGIFLDADGIVKENIDEAWDYFKIGTGYPLVGKGIFEYIMLGGRGNPANDDTLEKPLMDLLGVKERSMHYVTTNFIIFTKWDKSFLQEWRNLANNPKIINDNEKYALYHDETLMNVLLWKRDAKVHLPLVHFNLIDSDNAIEFYETDKTDTKLNSEWQVIPKNKNDIKYFHGCKSLSEIDKTLEIISTKKRRSKIAIVTLADDNYKEISDISLPNIIKYAVKNNYTVISIDHIIDKNRPPQWSKIKAIEQALAAGYEWVWWIDSDALIMNDNIKLEDIIDDNYEMIFTENKYSYISNGSSFFKNTANVSRFLKECYNLDRDILKDIDVNVFDHEQQPMRKLLQNDSEYSKITKIIPERTCNSFWFTDNKEVLDSYPNWNNEINIYQNGDFIINFCGRNKEERIRDMKRFLHLKNE